jgi:hypothetical protein
LPYSLLAGGGSLLDCGLSLLTGLLQGFQPTLGCIRLELLAGLLTALDRSLAFLFLSLSFYCRDFTLFALEDSSCKKVPLSGSESLLSKTLELLFYSGKSCLLSGG